MKDMGYKVGKESMDHLSSGDGKVHYPSIRLEKNIPDELKDKKIGHMCKLSVLGKITSISDDQYGESMTIEIHKIGYGDKGKNYEDMSDEEKDKADKEEVLGEEE